MGRGEVDKEVDKEVGSSILTLIHTAEREGKDTPYFSFN